MNESKLTDFQFMSQIGRGSSGKIFKVRRTVDNNLYVMKVISLSSVDSASLKEAISEARLLAQIDCPFIVKYYESFITDNSLHIVMEFCDKGDLSSFINRQMGRPLQENTVWKIFLQICLGVEYLHTRRIIHRDLKSLNTFMFNGLVTKIGDLGVAKVLQQTEFAYQSVGTPYYLSPEIIEEKPYNEKNDIWALGCILYQLLTLKPPFDGRNQQEIFGKILMGNYHPISPDYSEDIRSIVKACLAKDPKNRPSIQDLLQGINSDMSQIDITIPKNSAFNRRTVLGNRAVASRGEKTNRDQASVKERLRSADNTKVKIQEKFRAIETNRGSIDNKHLSNANCSGSAGNKRILSNSGNSGNIKHSKNPGNPVISSNARNSGFVRIRSKFGSNELLNVNNEKGTNNFEEKYESKQREKGHSSVQVKDFFKNANKDSKSIDLKQKLANDSSSQIEKYPYSYEEIRKNPDTKSRHEKHLRINIKNPKVEHTTKLLNLHDKTDKQTASYNKTHKNNEANKDKSIFGTGRRIIAGTPVNIDRNYYVNIINKKGNRSQDKDGGREQLSKMSKIDNCTQRMPPLSSRNASLGKAKSLHKL